MAVKTERGDLHKSVRPNLPLEERLAALTEICFQYAMEQVEEEITDIDGIKSLHCSARDKITNVVSNLKNDGVFHKACTKEIYVPNSQNDECARTIAELEAHEKQLTKESEQWLERKESTGSQALEASLIKIKDYIGEDDLSPANRSNASNYLPYTMDYNSVLKDLQKKDDVATHIICQHAQSARLLTGVHNEIINVLNNKRQDVDVVSFPCSSPNNTPRRLITGLPTTESSTIQETNS